MALAARSIPPRLDPAQGFRPWFLIRGRNGVPHELVHDTWDLGDMTGRYLEGLVMARSMGITSPELSQAEQRLAGFLTSLLGPDGLVHKPDNGEVDHVFSQGSALYGLVAWYETTGDPTAREAIERLIHGLRAMAEEKNGCLTFRGVRLPESCGSHLAGYGITPIVRFYELTGNAEALALAEGLTRWVLSDPVVGPDGAITRALSWEGHIHSWLDAMAGCLRTARVSPSLDDDEVLRRCRSVYDWVKRTNGTDFGWFATYPTGGSCETCAISSAIRLALELCRAGLPEYYNDVERFARNQAVEAQFRDLAPLAVGDVAPTPLLLGTFDSQSMPNSHLGTRGGEDVGTVEGCCLNGGMRAIYLAWQAAVTEYAGDVRVNLGISRDSPWAEVTGHDPFDGRVDVRLRYPARRLLIRVPDWVDRKNVTVQVDGQPASARAWSEPYLVLWGLKPGQNVSVRYPLRKLTQDVRAGGKDFRIAWSGDTVTAVDPPGERDRLYQRIADRGPVAVVPDTHFLQDAAVAAAGSILARLDADRGYQPFFRVYPFADPPYASHEKWDDGDMSGRYVEALILARRMTGIPMDPREHHLRQYLASLFDPVDGLAYTRGTEWTPRRACLFSQSCAMMGLLAWYDESGSPQARALLDRHVDGLMRLAVKGDGYSYFPKYEYDGRQWIDDPKDKDAPAWYGGRVLWPLVEYWKRFPRADVQEFIERLARYSIEVNPSIKPDGEVRGNGWWGHLHGTQDMVAGIVEYARLADKPEWVAWGGRVYDWIGRTHTSRFGWIADCSGSHICESCGIAARFRLGLALYRAGAADPFGAMDRFVRNQLLENQFADLSFLKPLKPDTAAPKGGQRTYRDVDRMILGCFQCWGTANDLIGHDDIEGCGAGGGMQALYFAWRHAVEWKGDELRVHLLFNRRVGAGTDGPVDPAHPPALDIASHLPYAGRVDLTAHRPVKVRVRLPDGTDLRTVRLQRDVAESAVTIVGGYARLPELAAGESAALSFALPSTETDETAAGKVYHVKWKGNTVLGLEPRGERMPLYTHRASFVESQAPLCAPRYP